MEILVIDGQGGRIGQQLIKAILTRYPQVEVTAIGTNSLATSAMLKGGASQGATGENALLVACRRADVILGPLGIVIADALMGEISPAMAVAVGQARARRILIPLNQCDNLVAGVAELPVARLLESANARPCLSGCFQWFKDTKMKANHNESLRLQSSC